MSFSFKRMSNCGAALRSRPFMKAGGHGGPPLQINPENRLCDRKIDNQPCRIDKRGNERR